MSQKILEVILGFKDQLTPGIKKTAAGSMSPLNQLTTGFKQLVGIIGGLVILRQAARWMGECVKAAMEQEAAVTRLNAALMASGNYTATASDELQKYATATQTALGVGDELTLSILGTIEGITKLSTEALPKAMDAVIQIANLYNKDYATAAQLLSKTLISNTNAFARMGLEIDMSKDALGRLNEIQEKTSAGMVIATEKTKTYEGQMLLLTIAWDELKESIGGFVTASPGIKSAIKELTDRINEQTEAVSESKTGIDNLGEAAKSLADKILFTGWAIDWYAGLFQNLSDSIWNACRAMDAWLEKKENQVRSGFIADYNKSWPGQLWPISGGAGATTPSTRTGPSWFSLGLNGTPPPTYRGLMGPTIPESEIQRRLLEAGGGGGGGGGGTTDTAPWNFWKKPMRDFGVSIKEPLQDIDAFCMKMRLLKEALQETAAASEDLRIRGLLKEKAFNADFSRVYPKAGPSFKMRKGGDGSSWYGGGLKTLGSNDFLWGMAGMAATADSGADFMQSALPMIGSAFGAPGAAIGGLLGMLFKKKDRGNTQSNPLYVYMTNTADLATVMLNIGKLLWSGVGAAGINNITMQLKAQAPRVGG